MNKLSATYNRGAALLIFVILFLVISLSLTLTIGKNAYEDLAKYRVLSAGKQSWFAAEAGIEDAVYRHRQGENYSNSESFTLLGTAVTIVRTTYSDRFEFVAMGDENDAIRSSSNVLGIGNGASFNFGLQSGNGGILMENNSSIRGNVFANGTVRGENNNIVRGDVISAGASGLIDGVHATGSAWAHRIESSTIGKDAYYSTIVGSSVFGSSCVNAHCHPGSADQATATMPITDAQIDGWKSEAAAGTVYSSTSTQCSSGTFKISVDTTIGPAKIECNLLIENNSTDLYLNGPLWVTGNIDIVNAPTLRIGSAQAGKSVSVIADKTTNRTTSSKIVLQNNAVFVGNGVSTVILLISRNNSNEIGGGEVAINMKNNATGAVILYAPHGEILVENGSGIKSVTGYKIHTQNNTEVIYETGLISLLFSGGPSGGYTVASWKEVE